MEKGLNPFTSVEAPRQLTLASIAEGEFFFDQSTEAGYVYYRLVGGESIGSLILRLSAGVGAFGGMTGNSTITGVMTLGGTWGFQSTGATIHTINGFHGLRGFSGSVKTIDTSVINYNWGGGTTTEAKADGLLASDSGEIFAKGVWFRDCGDECVQINANTTQNGNGKGSVLEIESSIIGPTAGKFDGTGVVCGIEPNTTVVAGAIGLDVVIKNCIIYADSTNIQAPFQITGVASGPTICTVDMQNVVIVNDTASANSAFVNADAQFSTQNYAGLRWGGSSSAQSAITGNMNTAFQAGGENLADMASQFIGGAPTDGIDSTNDIAPGSALIDAGVVSGVVLDFYQRAFVTNDIGAYAFISGAPTLTGPLTHALTHSLTHKLTG